MGLSQNGRQAVLLEEAASMLGGVGVSVVEEAIKAGQLKELFVGSMRLVSMVSIENLLGGLANNSENPIDRLEASTVTSQIKYEFVEDDTDMSEGYVKQMNTSKWIYQLDIAKNKANGKRTRESRSFDTEAEAQAALEVRKMELEAEKRIIEMDFDSTQLGEFTLDEYFELYLKIRTEDVESGDITSQTFDGYCRSLERVGNALGKVKLKNLTTELLKNYWNSVSEIYTRQSISKYYGVLSMALKYAAEEIDGFVWKNPLKKSCKPKRTKEAREQHIFTADKINDIMTASGNVVSDALMASAAFSLLSYTGYRNGELRGLKWGDINWQNRTINLKRAVINVVEGRGYNKLGKVKEKVSNDLKTESSKRILQVPSDVLEALEGWRQFMRENEGYNEARNDDYVFVDVKGKLVTNIVLRRRMREMMAALGLTDYHYTPYSFRRSFCSILRMQKVSDEVIKRAMGHTKNSNMINRYTFIPEDNIIEAMETLHSAISANRTANESANG